MIEGHGDDLYKYDGIKMNFSSNTNCYADLKTLEHHLKTVLAKAIACYPEPQPKRLEALIADRSGILPEEVCVTSGGTEAIYLIAQTFKGSKSVIPQPTFSEYADACRIHGHIVSVEATAAGGYETRPYIDDVQLRSCSGRASARVAPTVWLCNPNNPTGKVIPKNILEETISKSEGTLFVVDQSYESFTLCPLLTDKEAVKMGNVLLIHSMTKRYAIPGLRLGYIVGDTGLLNRVRAQRMPWSVNSLAIEAGIFLTNAGGYTTRPYRLEGENSGQAQDLPLQWATARERVIAKERSTARVAPTSLQESQRLRNKLNEIPGIETFDSDTHFFLARLTNCKASDLKEYLARQHGILIRDASNFPTLDQGYFRIAARTPEENDLLIEAIKMFLNTHNAQ